MAASFGSPLAPLARVGDAIIRFRTSAPDPCATLPAPQTPVFNTQSPGSLNLNGNNFYGVQTWMTPWGETAPSPEAAPVAIPSNSSINLPINPTPGVTRGRTYFGFGTGQEAQYIDIDETSMAMVQNAIVNGWPGATLVISGSGQPAILTVFTNAANNTTIQVYNYPGVPPRKNSAWLPNTDGKDLPAVTAFSWLDKAMTRLSIIAGGIRDDGGANPAVGQDQLVIPGRWLMIDDMWWDGWYVFHEHRIYTWMWGQVQSVPGISSTWINGGQQVINVASTGRDRRRHRADLGNRTDRYRHPGIE